MQKLLPGSGYSFKICLYWVLHCWKAGREIIPTFLRHVTACQFSKVKVKILPYEIDGELGTSVGIATGYGLECPGIEFWWGRAFPHLSRPILGPTQPPVEWVRGFSRERDADPLPPSSAEV
jgi:hypothetical protein